MMTEKLRELIDFIESREKVVAESYPKEMAYDDIVSTKNRIKKALLKRSLDWCRHILKVVN